MLSCEAKPHTRPPQNLSYVGGGVSLDTFLAELCTCISEMRRQNSTDRRKENQSQSGSQSKNCVHIPKKKKDCDGRRAFYTDDYQEILGIAFKDFLDFFFFFIFLYSEEQSFVPSL